MITNDTDFSDYFNRWFKTPIVVADNSISGIMSVLNRHPIAEDERAQNYIMPVRRCPEREGRYRVLGENQDVYYCFVYAGDETKADAPVYFESALDLIKDYGIALPDVIDKDHVLVADSFKRFVWYILGQYIAVRDAASPVLCDGVSGVIFQDALKLGDEFFNPLVGEFPAGYTCYFSDEVIYAHGWGAAFLTPAAREAFLSDHGVKNYRKWDL